MSYCYLWLLKTVITLEYLWHSYSLTIQHTWRLVASSNTQDGPLFIQSNVKLLKARPVTPYSGLTLAKELGGSIST
jgi:hypothetical protein